MKLLCFIVVSIPVPDQHPDQDYIYTVFQIKSTKSCLSIVRVCLIGRSFSILFYGTVRYFFYFIIPFLRWILSKSGSGTGTCSTKAKSCGSGSSSGSPNTDLLFVNVKEWIEALSFYHYLCYDKLITCQEVQAELTFQHRSVLSTSSKFRNVPAESTSPEPERFFGRRESPVPSSP